MKQPDDPFMGDYVISVEPRWKRNGHTLLTQEQCAATDHARGIIRNGMCVLCDWSLSICETCRAVESELDDKLCSSKARENKVEPQA